VDTLAALLGDGDRRLAQLAADALVRIGSEGVARLDEVAAATPQGPNALAARAALDMAALRGQLAAGAGRS